MTPTQLLSWFFGCIIGWCDVIWRIERAQRFVEQFHRQRMNRKEVEAILDELAEKVGGL